MNYSDVCPKILIAKTLEIAACNEDFIHVSEHKINPTDNFVNKSLEYDGFINKNSKLPKLVVTTVFGTLSEFIGICQ